MFCLLPRCYSHLLVVAYLLVNITKFVLKTVRVHTKPLQVSLKHINFGLERFVAVQCLAELLLLRL